MANASPASAALWETRLEAVKPVLQLVGRVLLSAIFVVAGIRSISDFPMFSSYMAAFGVPWPKVLLPLAIILEIGAGLMLVLGIRAREASAVLLAYTVLVMFVFHAFWRAPEAQFQAQLNLFLFHLTTLGGLAYVAACGPGSLSLRVGDRARGAS